MADETVQAIYTSWKRTAKAYVKGTLRRRADALLPSREVRAYAAWIKQRQLARKNVYTQAPLPGLFSILTPVWNGSPLGYLRQLAQSIEDQNRSGASQWVVLNNGCSDNKLLRYLEELRLRPWVKVVRVEANLGITKGLRRCLEEADGRYVLPVDADDLLYPDALQIAATVVVEAGFPALLYTDEDKVIGSRRYQPYLKPDWDPVLLLNSAYIAHLGIIEREKSLALGAYSDEGTEGSPDWDLFVRFLMAGYAAVHIPEVVYSWRVHASSTADDAATKPYIAASQRKVLERYLDAQPAGHLFEMESSPLLGGAHWHFRRKQIQPRPFLIAAVNEPGECAEQARSLAEQDGFVCFLGSDLVVDTPDWQWEVSGVVDLHPDTAMVGGRVRDRRGYILEAGLAFEAGGVCANSNRGRAGSDPGYFGQIWKQRSVDAVSTQFAAIRARFLVELLEQLPTEASLTFLGSWAGLYAKQARQRVVYSPFLSGVSDLDWEQLVSNREKLAFRERYQTMQAGHIKTFQPSKARQS